MVTRKDSKFKNNLTSSSDLCNDITVFNVL